MLQYPVCYRHDDDNDNAHGREKREGKTRSDPTKDKLTVHPPEGDSSMHERGWQRLEIRRARKGECSLIFGGWRVWDVCGSLIRPLSTKMRILPFPNFLDLTRWPETFKKIEGCPSFSAGFLFYGIGRCFWTFGMGI